MQRMQARISMDRSLFDGRCGDHNNTSGLVHHSLATQHYRGKHFRLWLFHVLYCGHLARNDKQDDKMCEEKLGPWGEIASALKNEGR